MRVIAPGQSEKLHDIADSCQRGMSWIWDDVKFEILHPAPGTLAYRNNQSCVLKITAGKQSILFTGDIEAPIERKLVSLYGASLQSTVLVVPHHGSRSSSSKTFICHVSPALAIVSAGFMNRWGFPKREIVDRYRDHGIPVVNTALEGGISLTMNRRQRSMHISGYRGEAAAIWRSAAGSHVASVPEFQYYSRMLRQQDAKLDEAKIRCLN